jgi:hypothetical protein
MKEKWRGLQQNLPKIAVENVCPQSPAGHSGHLDVGLPMHYVEVSKQRVPLAFDQIIINSNFYFL